MIGSLTAALLAAVPMGMLPRAVNAADYEQTQEQTEERSDTMRQIDLELMPYGPYEMLTQEQRATYIRVRQLKQKYRKLPTGYSPNAQDPEEAMALSQEELDSIWHCPLALDTYVSSPFGMRFHPVYRYYRMHNGVDLDADRGDDILAARGGTVIASGWHNSYGYYVRIDHGDGFVTEYFHMSRRLVKKGDTVAAGDVIGRVGSTGVSTGPHLHFGMKFEDEYVDPEDYIEF